jgi:hypothetical protein
MLTLRLLKVLFFNELEVTLGLIGILKKTL